MTLQPDGDRSGPRRLMHHDDRFDDVLGGEAEQRVADPHAGAQGLLRRGHPGASDEGGASQQVHVHTVTDPPADLVERPGARQDLDDRACQASTGWSARRVADVGRCAFVNMVLLRASDAGGRSIGCPCAGVAAEMWFINLPEDACRWSVMKLSRDMYDGSLKQARPIRSRAQTLCG